MSTDIVRKNLLLKADYIDEKVLAADNLVFWAVLWAHFIAWGTLCAMSVITF